jgi:hypothetical protein
MKLYQICMNARSNGMIEDPRTVYNAQVNSYLVDCGFRPKPRTGKLIKCCGNCVYYSVQK